jgi:hypothetical protein
MDKENNFKKLLCYNIVNNNDCIYKNKCMFAHELAEQKKDILRDYIYKIILINDDLCNINIFENKSLMNELLIYTKECKNCINNKCPGGYNCKFGACTKELKICYNDLLYGKCFYTLKNEVNKYGKTYKKCINGIHLTEKNLVPYNQRLNVDFNITNNILFPCETISFFNKQNTISLLLNDNTISKIRIFLNKINNKNINIINSYLGIFYEKNFIKNNDSDSDDNNNDSDSNTDDSDNSTYTNDNNTYTNDNNTYTNDNNTYTNDNNTYTNDNNTYTNDNNTYINDNFKELLDNNDNFKELLDNNDNF